MRHHLLPKSFTAAQLPCFYHILFETLTNRVAIINSVLVSFAEFCVFSIVGGSSDIKMDHKPEPTETESTTPPNGDESEPTPVMTPEDVEEFFKTTIARLTSAEEREDIKSKVCMPLCSEFFGCIV